MNAIIRPEHYVLPAKHPANCRCREHESKMGWRTPSIPILRETGGPQFDAADGTEAVTMKSR
jgi:hypothetical protein